MQSAAAVAPVPSIEEAKPMATREQRPALTITPVLGIIIAACSLVSSVLGGWIGSATTASQWRGEVQTRLEYIERQRAEDKKEAEQKRQEDRTEAREMGKYYQAQNEAIGKQLAKIEALASIKK